MLNLFIFLFGLYCVFQKKRALKNANKYAAIKKKKYFSFLDYISNFHNVYQSLQE